MRNSPYTCFIMIRKSLKTKFLFFFLLLFIGSSCNKNEETDPPKVLINKPFKGQSLKVGESFIVSGSAIDEKGIKSIQVKLLDAELNNPYVLVNRQYDDLLEVDFSFDCIVEDPMLQSGSFWIRVRVYNQQSVFTQEFVEVHLNELEKKLEKVLVITDEYQESIKVYELDRDSGINDQALLNLNGEFLFSALSSPFQQFYLGIEQGQQEMKAYELGEFENTFNVDVSMPYPVFTYVMIEEPYLYYSSGNGQIKGIDAFGLEKFSTAMNLDTFPQRFTFSSKYLLAACKTRAWERNVLKLHYRASGASIWRKSIAFDIVDVRPFSEGEFLLFGNEEGFTRIYIYDAEFNTLELKSEQSGELQEVAAAGEKRFLLEIEDECFVFQIEQDLYSPITFFEGTCNLKYESLMNELYGFCGTELFVLDMESLEPKEIYSFKASIRDIQFMYNK